MRAISHLVCFLCLFCQPLSVLAQGTQQEVRVYIGPELSSYRDVLGSRFAQGAPEGLKLEFVRTSGTRAGLVNLLEHPNDIAFAQHTLFEKFLSDRPDGRGKLEFYGELPVCVFSVVRSGSVWTLSTQEVPENLRLNVVDVGLAGGDLVEGLSEFLEAAPQFSGAVLENRGGSHALARVLSRRSDLALFLEIPSRKSPIISQVIESDDLTFLANIGAILRGTKIDLSDGFQPATVDLASFGSERTGERRIRTICTTAGVVMNTNGDPDILDAVAQFVLDDALTINGSRDEDQNRLLAIMDRLWGKLAALYRTVLTWF